MTLRNISPKAYFLFVFLSCALSVNISYAEGLIYWSDEFDCCSKKADLDKISIATKSGISDGIYSDRIIRIKNIDNDHKALLVSIFGVVVSLAVSGYLPFWIDKRNNKKSVVDDFWIRQVIYPRTIQNILDYSSYVSSRKNEDFNEDAIDDVRCRYESQLGYITDLGLMCEAMGYQVDSQQIYDNAEVTYDSFINLCLSPGEIEFKDKMHQANKKLVVAAIRTIHDLQKSSH